MNRESLDIDMPRMNGLDATRIIRRDAPDCAKGAVAKSDLTRDLLPTMGDDKWEIRACCGRQKASVELTPNIA
jgi:CheY-like chemotaxis protein